MQEMFKPIISMISKGLFTRYECRWLCADVCVYVCVCLSVSVSLSVCGSMCMGMYQLERVCMSVSLRPFYLYVILSVCGCQ